MTNCPHCGAVVKPGWQFCAGCRAPIVAAAPAVAPYSPPPYVAPAVASYVGGPAASGDAVARKHQRLRLFAQVLKVLAVLVIVVAVIGSLSVGAIPGLGSQAVFPILLLSLVGGGMYAVMLWVWAEMILLAIRVEQNTLLLRAKAA